MLRATFLLILIAVVFGLTVRGQLCINGMEARSTIYPYEKLSNQRWTLDMYVEDLKACPENRAYIVGHFGKRASKRTRGKYLAELKSYLLESGIDEKRLFIYDGSSSAEPRITLDILFPSEPIPRWSKNRN